MKHILTISLCFLALASSVYGQIPLIYEDFESYTVGDYIGEASSAWTTWSGAPGTDEDGQISDEEAYSGTQSLKIFGSVTGGPMDVYLPIGLEIAYEVSYNIYVPCGASAYMNVQDFLSPDISWAFDLVFAANGTIALMIDQVEIAYGSYNPNEWTSVSLRMDPIYDRAEIVIGGEYISNVAFDGIIGGLDFYGFGDGITPGLYYIDDVLIVETDSVIEIIYGCIYVNACNYNPYAFIDDGSCEYISCYGCTIDTACNYGPEATLNDGSREYNLCYGCTIEIACNYDPEATLDDGNCEFICYGCTDFLACNFDSSANIDDENCEYVSCVGCIDGSACNYLSSSTIDDGSCVFPEPYLDCFCSCLNDSDSDGVCDELEILGCTDQGSCNYDFQATDADGSCEYVTCAGCQYEFACNYDPEAIIADNESCEFGSCPGCTDSTACNYNPTVSEDDGSCSYIIDAIGLCGGSCTSDSNNDGICDIQLCPEDLNSDGYITIQDLLLILSDFGCTSSCENDITQDGYVAVDDLLQVLSEFGNTCE